MDNSWFACCRLLTSTCLVFLMGGCGLNPLERVQGAMDSMGASTSIMAANTGAMSQSTRVMADHTAYMTQMTKGMEQGTNRMAGSTDRLADITERMAAATDRMAKSTEGMSEATKRMAESTDKMEKHMGLMSGGLRPVLDAEQKLESEHQDVTELIGKYREKWKHRPELFERLKKAIKEEFEK
jgi:hypothetical protein